MPFSAFCASLLLAAAAVAPAVSAPFAAERWNKRVLLAFADRPNAMLERQLANLVADRQALAERDMLVLQVSGNDVAAAFGEPPAGLSADALRQTYRIAPETPFTVILVGKDGGEKLRRSEPMSLADVTGLIDAMPMRRNEAGRD